MCNSKACGLNKTLILKLENRVKTNYVQTHRHIKTDIHIKNLIRFFSR